MTNSLYLSCDKRTKLSLCLIKLRDIKTFWGSGSFISIHSLPRNHSNEWSASYSDLFTSRNSRRCPFKIPKPVWNWWFVRDVPDSLVGIPETEEPVVWPRSATLSPQMPKTFVSKDWRLWRRQVFCTNPEFSHYISFMCAQLWTFSIQFLFKKKFRQRNPYSVEITLLGRPRFSSHRGSDGWKLPPLCAKHSVAFK